MERITKYFTLKNMAILAFTIALIMLLVFLYNFLFADKKSVAEYFLGSRNDNPTEPPAPLEVNFNALPIGWNPSYINDLIFKVYNSYTYTGGCTAVTGQTADEVLDDVISLNDDQTKAMINDWNARYYQNVNISISDADRVGIFDSFVGGPAKLSQTIQYESCGITSCYSCNKQLNVIQKLAQYTGG